MPLFAAEFGYTPAEWRALRYRDFADLLDFLAERARRREEAAGGGG